MSEDDTEQERVTQSFKPGHIKDEFTPFLIVWQTGWYYWEQVVISCKGDAVGVPIIPAVATGGGEV